MLAVRHCYESKTFFTKITGCYLDDDKKPSKHGIEMCVWLVFASAWLMLCIWQRNACIITVMVSVTCGQLICGLYMGCNDWQHSSHAAVCIGQGIRCWSCTCQGTSVTGTWPSAMYMYALAKVLVWQTVASCNRHPALVLWSALVMLLVWKKVALVPCTGTWVGTSVTETGFMQCTCVRN